MDFLIQTAWYSIELRGHAMAFHGTPSVLQGTPWDSMELYDIPWNSMDLQGDSVELHGIPWNSMDTPWILMDFHRFPWNSMEVFHTGLRITFFWPRFIIYIVGVSIPTLMAHLFL